MKKAAIYIAIITVLLISLFIGVRNWLNDRPDIRFGKERTAIINRIELLNRFETASYNVDKIIEVGTTYTGIKQILFGDKIILIAQGSVVAGFDMNKMTPADFSGTGTEITIKLPAPEIFSVIIDNTNTKVFDRDQGIFTKGEIDLEAEARRKAETEIRAAACAQGILTTATEQAKKQLELMFSAAGFTSIAITAPITECK